MATKDLGVWTADACALVLIDYQNEMFEVIRSETSADLVELNVRLLAKTAKAFDMPIVLSTVGVGYGFNGPTLPSILSELEGVEPIDRSSMNAFEDPAFRDAVKATGRKRLIIGRTSHRDLPHLRHRAGAQGRLRRAVPDRRRRWTLASRPPHRHRSPGARRGGSDHARWRSSPSCSGTGPGRWPGRPSTSSTGTSARSPSSPTRWASPRPRKSAAAKHGGH